MAWSYSGDPSASDLDMVRFLVGDTDSSDEQFSDEEINAMISATSTVFEAAARVCEALAANYARKTDKAMGDLRISFSQLQDHYMGLAQTIRTRATLEGVAPYVGGTSVAGKEAARQNEDRVAPSFRKGMTDFAPTTRPQGVLPPDET